MDAVEHLTSALSILAKIAKLEPPKDFDLFPTDSYKWLNKNNNLDICEAIEQAVTKSATEYFNLVVDLNKLKSDDNEQKLKQCIEVIQLVRSDLQRAVEHHDSIFQE